jgi:hypothetical protein
MDVAVWVMYQGLTEEEALIGARHMDSAVNKVQVHCTMFDFWESSKVPDEEEDGWQYNYNFRQYTEQGYCHASPAHQETRLFGPSFARSWASNAVAKLRNGEYAKAKYVASGDTDNSRTFLLPMLTPACGNCSGAPTRTGAEVDGTFICLYDIANNVKTNPPCLVYSFGSRNDFSFETFIHLQKNCEIHTFDCTVVDPQPPSFVKYHNWCLGFRSQQDPMFHTFDKIVVLLGHQKREISLLKIDIEGWEWHFFSQYLSAIKSESVQPIKQISFALHACDRNLSSRKGCEWSTFPKEDTWPYMNYSWPNSFIDLFEQLYTFNYKVVSWEPNTFYCAKYTVVLEGDHMTSSADLQEPLRMIRNNNSEEW